MAWANRKTYMERLRSLERELAPLLSVRDAFPKVLIARTRHEPYTREGVVVLDLARWLLGEQGL